MALLLEFKQRVRDVPDLPDRPERARRTPVLWLGILGWLGAVALGFSIDRGYLPLEHWLEQLELGDDPATAAPERTPEPPPPSPAATEPASAPGLLPPSDRVLAAPVPSPEPDVPTSTASAVIASQRFDDEPWPPEPNPPAEREALVRTPDYDQRLAPPTGAGFLPSAPAQRVASCEAAIQAQSQQIVMGAARSRPDLGQADYAAVLENGRWFERCGVPATTGMEVCIAVREGRAVGVTVRTTPRRTDLEHCVAVAARGLVFPSRPELDVTRTVFQAR